MDELSGKLVEGHGAVEDVAFRQVTEPLDPASVLGIVADETGSEMDAFFRHRRDSVWRAVAARYLIQYAGQTQRDIGRLLKAGSGSAISKQLSQHREALEEEGLAETLERIERRLEDARRKRHGKADKS